MEEKLIENLADILEVEQNQLEQGTFFKSDLYDFDSLKGYAIIIMLEEEFDVTMDVDDFIKCETIQDIMAHILEK